MPKFIIRLERGDKHYYMEWSTVVDVPVCAGMELEDFRDWYIGRYGDAGAEELPARLARAERTGLSSFPRTGYKSVSDLVKQAIRKTELKQTACARSPNRNRELKGI